ncbi:MAG: acyl transferase [Pelagibacterales bacterium]|nr:acyl transferase [Pelagibacterales bacterium]|tara:strand:- start:356 stop:1045 length:690 start_codon:yes stop_codon:yes gene_type:complete
MKEVTIEDLIKLQSWDTPTVCNALDVAAPERRALGFTNKPLRAVGMSGSVCGYVKTAKISSTTMPDKETQALKTKYYEYIDSPKKPSVVVIQDIDELEGFGCFWGEVNSAIHLGLGVKGLVTNGAVRDLDQWAKGFSALAGSIGPSHAYTHIVDYSETVNIYGMEANNADIIHFDKHGAVIIPLDVVKDIPQIIEMQSKKEEVILEAARAPDFSYNKFLEAVKGAEDIH